MCHPPPRLSHIFNIEGGRVKTQVSKIISFMSSIILLPLIWEGGL
nr:MAG TPA: hypothetical protein [Caudoviricetes sp.]